MALPGSYVVYITNYIHPDWYFVIEDCGNVDAQIPNHIPPISSATDPLMSQVDRTGNH